MYPNHRYRAQMSHSIRVRAYIAWDIKWNQFETWWWWWCDGDVIVMVLCAVLQKRYLMSRLFSSQDIKNSMTQTIDNEYTDTTLIIVFCPALPSHKTFRPFHRTISPDYPGPGLSLLVMSMRRTSIPLIQITWIIHEFGLSLRSTDNTLFYETAFCLLTKLRAF